MNRYSPRFDVDYIVESSKGVPVNLLTHNNIYNFTLKLSSWPIYNFDLPFCSDKPKGGIACRQRDHIGRLVQHSKKMNYKKQLRRVRGSIEDYCNMLCYSSF